jgi:hypothetical protein
LSSHATIHLGFVFIITGSLYLALAEFIVHGTIDWMKCEGTIGMLIDQTVHCGCKIAWAAVAIWVLTVIESTNQTTVSSLDVNDCE